jgi:hypothetical protein
LPDSYGQGTLRFKCNNAGSGCRRASSDADVGARRALIIRQSSGLGLFRAYNLVELEPVTTITATQIEDDDSRVAYFKRLAFNQ